MADGKDMERLFSEYLDRILAGGELPDTPDLDDEHRSALEFAVRMVRLRQSPSPAFRNALRVRLLERVGKEQSVREKRGGFFSGAFWRQPVWQAASLVVIAIIVVVVFWRMGTFSPGLEPQPTTTTATMTTTATTTTLPQGWILSADAATDKAVYKAGENVRIDIILRNTAATPVTLEKVPPILSLMEADTHQPVYTFSAGTVNQTLASGGATTFTYEWDQRDFDGQPVTGTYYISLEDLETDGMPVEIELSNRVEFEILAY